MTNADDIKLDRVQARNARRRDTLRSFAFFVMTKIEGPKRSALVLEAAG